MTLPFSAEAEEGVLSSMMLDPNEAIPECVKRLTSKHFFTGAHQTLFDLLIELWNGQKPIELITFTQHLRDRKLLDEVGGVGVVSHLFVDLPSASNLDYYIDIVNEKHTLRHIITTSTKASRRALDNQDEVEAIISEWQDDLNVITRPRASNARRSLFELVQEKITRMENGEDETAIIKTGITKLDYNSPLWQGDMPLLSGERKAGKSIFALTIMTNIARAGVPVAYFSLEDSAPKIIDRLLSGMSRVPMRKQVSVKELSEEEMSASSKAALALSALPIHIYDDLHDLHHIVAECRQLKAAKNIGLIVVDYAQLLNVVERRDRNREQEVAYISRSLRLLSLELHTPLLLLSQLNEQGRSRGSRALEQDATASWKILDKEEEPCARWIDIEWQRNGDSDIKFPITFLGYCARVENYQNGKVDNI